MTDKHAALAVFLGDWSAAGTSYGADLQESSWRSVHSASWHSGRYFVVQDERANGPFNTLSILGWDPERETYFSWSIENHGFSREYLVTREGHTWTFRGETERATTTFSPDGRTQTIHWEFRPRGEWAPLCDRLATRVD